MCNMFSTVLVLGPCYINGSDNYQCHASQYLIQSLVGINLVLQMKMMVMAKITSYPAGFSKHI